MMMRSIGGCGGFAAADYDDNDKYKDDENNDYKVWHIRVIMKMLPRVLLLLLLLLFVCLFFFFGFRNNLLVHSSDNEP